jgi:hypothetical protein
MRQLGPCGADTPVRCFDVGLILISTNSRVLCENWGLFDLVSSAGAYWQAAEQLLYASSHALEAPSAVCASTLAVLTVAEFL